MQSSKKLTVVFHSENAGNRVCHIDIHLAFGHGLFFIINILNNSHENYEIMALKYQIFNLFYLLSKFQLYTFWGFLSNNFVSTVGCFFSFLFL